MAALNSRKSAGLKAAMSVNDLIVRRSKSKTKVAPMLTEDIVPAGKYRSKVISVTDGKSNDGKPMADVTYSFTNAGGKAVEARVRYPISGYHVEKLFDALIEAGLPEESPLVEAVGIEEQVEIVYAFDGALGKIKARSPVDTAALEPKAKPKKRAALVDEEDADSDDEFDDDLDFEDDD